jgi:archaeosine-15-forming tRNA-guanine transglycosylase
MELNDCKLSEAEIEWAVTDVNGNFVEDRNSLETRKNYITNIVSKAIETQLKSPKLRAYIQEQIEEAVKAERERVANIVIDGLNSIKD